MQPARTMAAARENRWAELMQRGQPGSPLNMPEVVTPRSRLGEERESAFAQLMRAGQQTEASHGGCGGCEFDQPCEHCGTPRSDPTHQRAEWTQWVGDSTGGKLPFWRAAIMLDVFRQNDVKDEPPASKHSVQSHRQIASMLDSFVHSMQQCSGLGGMGAGGVCVPMPHGGTMMTSRPLCCCVKLLSITGGGQGGPNDFMLPREVENPPPGAIQRDGSPRLPCYGHNFNVNFEWTWLPYSEFKFCELEWWEENDCPVLPTMAGQWDDLFLRGSQIPGGGFNPYWDSPTFVEWFRVMNSNFHPTQALRDEARQTQEQNASSETHLVMNDQPCYNGSFVTSESGRVPTSRWLRGRIVVKSGCPTSAGCPVERLEVNWSQYIELTADRKPRTRLFVHW